MSKVNFLYNKIQLTNVSAGKLGGLFGLNRTDSGFGRFVLDVIVFLKRIYKGKDRKYSVFVVFV